MDISPSDDARRSSGTHFVKPLTFGQLQVQLRQMVPDLLRQSRQIHPAVRHHGGVERRLGGSCTGDDDTRFKFPR